MTKTRRDSLVLLLLGAVVFVLWGVKAERGSIVAMADFKSVYYGARCMLEHVDPYNGTALERIYVSEGGENPAISESARAQLRKVVGIDVNLPTALFLVAPIAALAWAPAHVLWMALIAAGLLIAGWLMWRASDEYASVCAAALIGFLVASSELLLEVGNTAGIAVSLCVIAAWCFVEERFVAAGVVCMAVSLAIKPQDAGLVWLFFLLGGAVYRRRALQSLVVTVALSLPGILWVSTLSPHWMQEMRANLALTEVRGALNNPGPVNFHAEGIGAMLVNLQTVVSLIRDNPRFYNSVTYCVCGALLLVWAVATLRSRRSPARDWLALAAIAALSMLPVYHRQHDTRLLLLMFPAFAMLWARGGPRARLAFVLSAATMVLTANPVMRILAGMALYWHLAAGGVAKRLLAVLMTRPAPLILLAVGIFYLWIYARFVTRDGDGSPSAL